VERQSADRRSFVLTLVKNTGNRPCNRRTLTAEVRLAGELREIPSNSPKSLRPNIGKIVKINRPRYEQNSGERFRYKKRTDIRTEIARD